MSGQQIEALSSMFAKSLASSAPTSTEIIQPSTKRILQAPVTPFVESVRLCPFDILMPPINMRLAMVFKIAPASESDTQGSSASFEKEFEVVVAKLKASLADALELYPPVAGTIDRSPTDPAVITINCDGRGARFMTQVESRAYVESEHTLDGLSGTDLFGLDSSKTIFAVKLTLFSCGTIVMITSMHHQAADLASYMDFIRTWHQISRKELEEIVLPVTWSRDLKLATPVEIPPTMPGILILPPNLTSPPLIPALRIFDGLRWFISDAKLAQLKLDCTTLISTQDPVKFWISTSDAFTALVWGAMTRGRQDIPTKTPMFTNQDADLESLGVAVDGREMIGLGSPRAGSSSRFFGNLNLSVAVYHPRVDLLQTTLEATSRVALAIRKTIQDETTPDAIASRAAFIASQVEATRPVTNQRMVLEGDCRSTNWVKHDLSKFDFGLAPRVKPVSTALGTKTVYPAGMFLITRGSGGLIVATTVEKEADVLLSSDPLLTKYAEILKD
ncbi:transferase [Lentinula raphanica]|uniref:Transferase n=1 Tax=Lentinula raphanica TaxID=153919 RepID=A0AA38PD91_9AGAR|nr:transferase [Lentinula raphanica]KAJ3840550.1 transferase [Lentinula raphanica]